MQLRSKPLLLTAGRECVVPEVSRNRNFGVEGVNMEADTFHRYFSRMAVVQVCKVKLMWIFHAKGKQSVAELVVIRRLWQILGILATCCRTDMKLASSA